MGGALTTCAELFLDWPLGNTKSANHAILTSNMLEAFQKLGCFMSIKMHFLFLHIEQFPDNLGAIIDKQGERFHQDMRQIEKRYQGRWDAFMMADYCWSLKRDNPAAPHKRDSKKRRFLPWTVWHKFYGLNKKFMNFDLYLMMKR